MSNISIIKHYYNKKIHERVFFYYLETIKFSPVISAGASSPITFNIVGAISANLPFYKVLPSVWFETHTNGTGAVV